MTQPLQRGWLWLVPAGLLVATTVILAGPYGELHSVTASSGGPFDENPRWSFENTLLHLQQAGEHGRRLYRAHFWWDLAMLAANSAALCALVAVSASRTRVRLPATLRRGMCALPLLAGLCDFVENIAVAVIISKDGVPSESVVLLAAAATTLKFVLFASSLIVAFAGVILWFSWPRD